LRYPSIACDGPVLDPYFYTAAVLPEAQQRDVIALLAMLRSTGEAPLEHL
jgi:hypothetical protein